MQKRSISSWTIDELQISYDKEADILYVKMSEGRFSHNLEVADRIVADIGAEGELLGLEVIAVSSILGKTDALLPEDCHVPWYLLSELSRSRKLVPA